MTWVLSRGIGGGLVQDEECKVEGIILAFSTTSEIDPNPGLILGMEKTHSNGLLNTCEKSL